jgi:hypothetical protein
MKARTALIRALLVACVLIAAQWILGRHLGNTDPLVELTRGQSVTTVGLLAALLAIRLVGIFVMPSWVAYRVYRWVQWERATREVNRPL